MGELAVLGMVAACLAAVLGAPAAVLLYGPLLLGAAHVAGDVLVLLVDPVVPVGRAARVAAGGVVLGAWSALALGGGWDLPVAIAAVAVGIASGAGGIGRRAALGAAVIALAGWAWASPASLRLALAHGHNAVAVLVMLAWTRASRPSLALAGGVAACLAALASGALDGPLGALSAPATASVVAGLAPGVAGVLALRITGAYALLQLVHYGVWIAGGPSLRPGLRRWWGAAAVAAALPTIGLLAWGTSDPGAARGGYLAIAGFHAWMELVVLAHQLAGGARAPLPGGARAAA